MIFGFVFDFVTAMGSWIASLLPSVGCGALDDFPTIAAGWVGSYINIPAALAAFGIIIAYEVAVFVVRTAISIYKLLPLT